MKHFFTLGIIALMITSCGTSEKIATITPEQDGLVKIEKNDCQKKAEEKSEYLRGYGIGVSADPMMARDIAALAARNEILNALQVSASNMIDRYNQQHNSSTSGEMARVDVGRVKQLVRNMAEETLRGAKIITTCDYKRGDKYETHVCVELTNVDFTTKAYNKLTKDEKLTIDYEAEEFAKEYEKEIEQYRQRKAEGTI